MGCACNKQKSNGLAAKRAESAPAPAPAPKAASAPRTSGVAGTSARAPMSGRTQSFALEQGGRTATFGSRLERDAAAIRSGARPL
ncbi:hypothetical protein QDA11_gp27 [Microbacterium phage Jayden]|uniref:Uncharacterized protein n=1 Tax=Microbacterium phage Jayden TaxID=2656550 RepID=A0A649VRV0_9CAUD|nr:hypothetical protein QDA11_gp27 [Microbacterium phage Jayden]QGJ95247.1 hypothetical protein PBI_JAYDEN_27 [Microbacterium phage Jayden]